MNHRTLLTSVALLSLAAPTMAQATCARSELVPALLTRRDTKLPGDGGVLVGFGYSTSSDDYEQSGPDPSDVTWVATEGHKPVALTRVALAPGLSTYRPAAGTRAFAIENKAGKQLGTFTVDSQAASNKLVAPAPAVLKVDFKSSNRGSSTVASLRLRQAPPAEAIALILYRVDASGSTAIAFTGLPDTHDKLTSLEVLRSGGRCANDVPGQGSLSGGQKITFAWVDAFGRLSPVSKPIIAKGKL